MPGVTTDYTRFKVYQPTNYPTIEDGLNTFITRELESIRQSLQSCKDTLKIIEARIAAGGL